MDEVVEINQIQDLNALAADWCQLHRDTAGATFFQSLDWLRVYWNHFGENQKLRVLVVKRDGHCQGILPLVVRREHKRIANIRILTYPLHDWGSFYGPIGPNPEATLSAALRHIRHTRRDWDLLDLRWIPHELSTTTCEALRNAGLRAAQRVWKQTAIVETMGSWDDYLASRKQKFRNSIRRYERRLAELGEVRFERYRPRGAAFGDDDPRWEVYNACVTLAERSWQGSSTSGTTLSHGPVRDFFRDAHLAAVRAGCLDLNLLRLDDRLVAFGYNYHFAGTVNGLRIGYDPDFAKAGVGKVLWARSFRDSFQREDAIYDIGPDSLAIKKDWLTHLAPIHACAYFPPLAAKSQALRVAYWVRDLSAPSPTSLVPSN